MSAASNVLSQTLQSITTTKKSEQEKRRKFFEAHKSEAVKEADKTQDLRERIELLRQGVEQASSSTTANDYLDGDRNFLLTNTSRYLEQSQYDPSISSHILEDFEATLRQRLDQQTQRHEFANLYYRLLSEWADPAGETIETSENQSLDEPFEHVERDRLQQLKDKFANVVFNPREIDEVEIDNYMNSLFEGDKATEALKELRKSMHTFGQSFMKQRDPFYPRLLQIILKALLRNDLLNDEAKMTIKDFIDNDVVLEEITDVLNLRFSNLKNWSWEADEGMYYEPRQQPNGKYRIMMDQEILQAVFLHFIAVSWAAQFKSHFKMIVLDKNVWKGPLHMFAEEKARHHYFKGREPNSSWGIEAVKFTSYLETFFCTSLPGSISEGADPYDIEESEDEDTKEEKSGLGIRQKLLRQIATDVIVRRSLHGDVAVVQSDLQWFATGLPHSTLFAILRFWGVPDEWLAFFKKFAEAPLRMEEIPGSEVRIRKRGIPITDAFEKLFGECVLFGMDVAVNQLSGMTLYRFHDDLWLSGDPAQCAKGWEAIKGYVDVLGLEINTTKTGSAYLSDRSKDTSIEERLPSGDICVGMLKLTESGEWKIDQSQVDAHIRKLHKQLGASTSIIAWVQIWNSCMGQFFRNAFGKPANCFGQDHVRSILETFSRMQKELFENAPGSSVTAYLRNIISQRLDVANVPDSFFFLPEELGGLGLINPFIPFFAILTQVYKDPQERIRKFYDDERQSYQKDRDIYNALTDTEKRRRIKKINDIDGVLDVSVNDPFMSFEEYTAHRELYGSELRMAYIDFMLRPPIEDISLTNEVKGYFEELEQSHGIGWYGFSSEKRWIMNLYAKDLEKQFGALSIVDKNLLPSGVIKMLKERKVTWQLILWD